MRPYLINFDVYLEREDQLFREGEDQLFREGEDLDVYSRPFNQSRRNLMFIYCICLYFVFLRKM